MKRASRAEDARGRAWRLLLCCARTRMDPPRAAQVRSLLRSQVDWDYLHRAALRHGIGALLAVHLDAAGGEAVPAEFRSQLKTYLSEHTKRNLFLTGELLKLLNLLEAHAIPAVSLRGPGLAASLYGSLALRRFTDLDLFVRRKDFAKARDLIVSQGYEPQVQLAGATEREYVRSQREIMLKRSDGVLVELSWALAPAFFSFPLAPGGVWRHLRPTCISGRPALGLAPEDLLLALCAHGAKHLWARLGWICDVSELIRARRDIVWPRVLRQARTLGSERMLLLGVFLARDLLGAAAPEAVSHGAQADGKTRALAAQVKRWLPLEEDPPSGALPSMRFHLAARERLHDRIRYCLEGALRPSYADWRWMPLPDPLFFLYYLIRPVRIVGEALGGALRRLLGRAV